MSELDSNLVISAQPISEQALTRAEIEEEAEIPMLMEEPAPTREEIERVPTALSYSPEPIFLGAPSAPSPPIDFSDSKTRVLTVFFYRESTLIRMNIFHFRSAVI